MNLDQETGISIMRIAEKLDTGPVCNNYKIQLDENLNALEISEKLSNLAAEKILDNVYDILEDKSNFFYQHHLNPTYASKIQKTEGQINSDKNPKKIIGKINGLYPSPPPFFNFNGETYKILKAQIQRAQPNPASLLSNNL
jgi:Methionyl-tRNA formyltransferase